MRLDFASIPIEMAPRRANFGKPSIQIVEFLRAYKRVAESPSNSETIATIVVTDAEIRRQWNDNAEQLQMSPLQISLKLIVVPKSRYNKIGSTQTQLLAQH